MILVGRWYVNALWKESVIFDWLQILNMDFSLQLYLRETYKVCTLSQVPLQVPKADERRRYINCNIYLLNIMLLYVYYYHFCENTLLLSRFLYCWRSCLRKVFVTLCMIFFHLVLSSAPCRAVVIRRPVRAVTWSLHRLDVRPRSFFPSTLPTNLFKVVKIFY